MNMKDAMLKAGADYNTTLNRFAGNEALLAKFLKKFEADPTYSQLKEQIALLDQEKIYFYGHTLKGVCSNLGFDKLSGLCAQTILKAREGNMTEAVLLFQKLSEEYEFVISCIREGS